MKQRARHNHEFPENLTIGCPRCAVKRSRYKELPNSGPTLADLGATIEHHGTCMFYSLCSITVGPAGGNYGATIEIRAQLDEALDGEARRELIHYFTDPVLRPWAYSDGSAPIWERILDATLRQIANRSQQFASRLSNYLEATS